MRTSAFGDRDGCVRSEREARRRHGDLSAVCRVWRKELWRGELRVRDIQTMPGDDRGQRRLLQTESLVHAVSAATQRRPTDLAMRLPPRSE